MRGSLKGWVLVPVVVLLGAVSAGPAAAQTSSTSGASAPEVRSAATDRRPALAQFEGRRLDLSGDWAEARACLVFRQGGVLECFRSTSELDARAAQLSPIIAASSFYCGSPLRLFEHAGFSGRQLMFYDRGYWQNLGDYGFNDQLSSYIVGACFSYMAEHHDGAGFWYGGNTNPYASQSLMPWPWNDRVSSIYLG